MTTRNTLIGIEDPIATASFGGTSLCAFPLLQERGRRSQGYHR
jgi:hypothetical protein